MLHYTEAIGLDIGSHAVKAVHLRRQWGCLRAYASVRARLPQNADDRRRILESLVAKNGWTGMPCVVAPPAETIMLQSISVPPADPRSSSGIVELEMSQLHDYSDAATVYDYSVQRETNGRRILLTVAREDGVQAALHLASAAGLHPVQVIPEATALFNVVSRRWRGGRQSTFIIVDVGHHRTTVVVGTRRTLLDARYIPHGGEHFGVGIRSIGATTTAAVLEEVDRWLDALADCLAVCTGLGEPDTLAADGMVLVGGGAHIAGLKERLTTRFDIPVSPLGDWGTLASHDNTEHMALAMGLAMAGMGIGRIRLTLLPPDIRKTISLHSQAGYWIAGCAALMLAMLILVVGATLERHQKQMRLKSARAHLNAIITAEKQLETLETQNAKLNTQLQPFATLVHNGDILRTAIGAVTRAKHPNDWLTHIADSSAFFQGDPPPARNIAPFDELIIEGYTPTTDLSSIRNMIEALRESPGILDADLLEDNTLEQRAVSDVSWNPAACEPFTIGLTLPTP